MNKLKENATLKQAVEVFDSVSSTQEDIESAGEKALVAIYNGKKEEKLDTLHLTRYCKKVTKSLKQVEPKSIPPTSSAAKYHSYRVFFQICQWKSFDCNLQPELWGWSLSDG